MGSCPVPLGEVGKTESKFVGIYNSAVTGTFAAVSCASLTLVAVSGSVALYGKRTIGSNMYVLSLVLANAIQVACFCATWGMRIWCPGMMSDEYCRAVLTLGSISEAAASFFFTYIVLDRVCELGGISENPRYGTKSGRNLKGSIWVCFIAWSSALIIGCPALSGKTLQGKSGMIPVCEFTGTDGIMHLMLHTTVVYVVPSLILMTKHIEARRRAENIAIWSVMRKACIFYTVYFVLVVPVLLAKTASYMNRDLPFPSTYDYIDLIATILYQLRVVDFAFSSDVIIDDTKHIVDVEVSTTIMFGSNGGSNADPPPLFYGTVCELREMCTKLMTKLMDVWGVLGKRILYIITGKETDLTSEEIVQELTASSSVVFGTAYDNKGFVDDNNGDGKNEKSEGDDSAADREIKANDEGKNEMENREEEVEVQSGNQIAEPQVVTEITISPFGMGCTRIGNSVV